MGYKKSYVRAQEEPLRYLCNAAFFGVRSLLPERWNDQWIAFTEGLLGGYLLASGGAALTKALSDEKTLETIARGCVLGTIALPVGNFIIAPEYMRDFVKKHPTYASGVLGVMAGAVARGIQEFL